MRRVLRSGAARRFLRSPGHLSAFCFFALVAAGCRSTAPVSWQGEALIVSWSHLPGRLLPAPEAIEAIEEGEPQGIRAEDCCEIQLRAVMVDADAVGHGVSLIDAARMIVGMDEPTPVNVTPDLLARSFFVDLDTAARLESDDVPSYERAFVEDVILPTGTFSFSLSRLETVRGANAEMSVELRLALSNGEADMAVIVRGLPRVPLPGEFDRVLDDDPTEEGPTKGTRREAVVLEDPIEPGAPTAWIAIAPPFAAAAGRLILLGVTLSPAPATSPDSAFEALVRAAEAEVLETSQSIPQSSRGAPIQEARSREIERSIRALAEPDKRREALLWLTSYVDVGVTLELALLGSQEQLATFVQAPLPPPEDLDVLAWALESRAMMQLTGEVLGGTSSPSTESILLRHGGALAPYPELLQTAVASAGSTSALKRLIVEENLLFLSDKRVLDRVRAYDWLAAEHIPIPGYDPMADDATRRQALEELAERMQDPSDSLPPPDADSPNWSP